MKIVISKSQWEEMGKTAGWLEDEIAREDAIMAEVAAIQGKLRLLSLTELKTIRDYIEKLP